MKSRTKSKNPDATIRSNTQSPRVTSCPDVPACLLTCVCTYAYTRVKIKKEIIFQIS
jgi:hypothetical protein